jgi:hypothetical protein
MRAPETIARAGHDGDASVKPDCHELFSRISFLVMPGLTRASIKNEMLFTSDGSPGQARR